MKLTLVTPEKKVVTGAEVDSVLVPAYRGELNILEGHTPLVTTLDTGIMRWKVKGSEGYSHAVISWGYCEVFPNGVDILAEFVDLPEEVDEIEAKEIMASATKRLSTESLTDSEYADAARNVKRGEADIALTKYKN